MNKIKNIAIEKIEILDLGKILKSLIVLFFLFILAYAYFTLSSVWNISKKSSLESEIYRQNTVLAELEMLSMEAESTFNLEKAVSIGLFPKTEEKETFVAKNVLSLNATRNE